MDSFTLLHRALAEGYRVHALSFDYGQRHVRELEAAAGVCSELGLPHKVLDIRSLQAVMAGSALTGGGAVPEGHYEEESMKSTVVPNRNMILLSLATGYAVTVQADAVWFGAHGGDHAIYPDCRPEFVEKMDAVCRVANYEPVAVEAPTFVPARRTSSPMAWPWNWTTARPGPVTTVARRPVACVVPASNDWKPLPPTA